jgi:photosystem II stability/assembly factor-like uncharacterized protein
MLRRHLSLAVLIALVSAASFTGCECGSAITGVQLPPLSAVILTPPVDTLVVGQQRLYTAVAKDTNDVTVAGAAFAWSSSDPGVFTVNGNGRVTAVGEGVAQLVAAAGGLADTSTLVVFLQPGWYAQPSSTSNDLNGVFFQANGRDGWAVGDAGTIVHTGNAGASWGSQPSSTAFNLNDVWFTSDVTGFAVGHGGTVMRTRNGGLSWTRLTNVPATENLFGVCFVDSSIGWAVGSNGITLRTANGGASWTKKYPTANQLNSVSFSDASNGWAVGEGGVIVGTHDGGVSWYVVQPAVTANSLRSVWRNSNTLAWAAGLQGTYPFTTSTPDSLQWVLGSLGATNQISGLQMVDGSVGYAVGTNGTGLVLKTLTGGSSWGPQISNTAQSLNDVWFVDPLRGWAVGVSGRIIHTSKGGN